MALLQLKKSICLCVSHSAEVVYSFDDCIQVSDCSSFCSSGVKG